MASHAIATGQPILIDDAETDQNMRRRVGDKSLICVPFFDGGRAVGALNVVSSSHTDRLDEDDRETMEILAVVLSSAVSQATAFELKRQAELNRHQALHDSLTGLPNRVLFRERIEHALRRARRSSASGYGVSPPGPPPLDAASSSRVYVAVAGRALVVVIHRPAGARGCRMPRPSRPRASARPPRPRGRGA